jgi:hypothetical protein
VQQSPPHQAGRDNARSAASILDFDRKAIAGGAAEYLQKPLKKRALIRALREHMPGRFEAA